MNKNRISILKVGKIRIWNLFFQPKKPIKLEMLDKQMKLIQSALKTVVTNLSCLNSSLDDADEELPEETSSKKTLQHDKRAMMVYVLTILMNHPR